MTEKSKSMFKELNEGKVGLIQKGENNTVVQIALTEEQSDMLQMFLSAISKEKPLVKLPSDYDLVFKNQN